jgi:hypothetical protein
VAVLAAVIVFVGFARTYFLKELFGAPTLRPPLHLHGFLFTAWIVLFLVQTSLVVVKRTDIHRKLGVAGGLLALLMVVIGPLTAITAARRGEGSAAPPDIPPLVFLVVPLGDIVIFVLLVGAAFYYRREIVRSYFGQISRAVSANMARLAGSLISSLRKSSRFRFMSGTPGPGQSVPNSVLVAISCKRGK